MNSYYKIKSNNIKSSPETTDTHSPFWDYPTSPSKPSLSPTHPSPGFSPAPSYHSREHQLSPPLPPLPPLRTGQSSTIAGGSYSPSVGTPAPFYLDTPRGVSPRPLFSKRPKELELSSLRPYSTNHTSGISPSSSTLASPSSFRAHSPNLSPSEYIRSPIQLRSPSPLPKQLEIAIPPGAQLPTSESYYSGFGRGRLRTNPFGLVLADSEKSFYHHEDNTPADDSSSIVISLPASVYIPEGLGVGDREIAKSSASSPALTLSPAPYQDNQSFSGNGSSQYSLSSYYPHDALRIGGLRSPSPKTIVSPTSVTGKRSYVPQPSSLSELVELWDIAQGIKYAPKVAKDGHIYILSMCRQASLLEQQPSSPLCNAFSFPEHFIFGPNSYTPFYTFQALQISPHDTDFSELLLARRDPRTSTDSTVVRMTLESPRSRTSGDGLVTLIYPKLAVLAAISTAASATVVENISRVAQSAIKSAARTECCRLCWNPEKRRYYLYHPGIGPRGDVYLIDIDEAAGARESWEGMVKLMNVDTNEVIVALDFARGVLLVDTVATKRVPNRWLVDVAVAAVLCVAVVEGRRYRRRRSRSRSRKYAEYGSRPQHELKLPPPGQRKQRQQVVQRRGEQKPKGLLDIFVTVVKGIGWLFWFTGGLVWAITKAIFDAFRSDPYERQGQGRGH